MAVLIDVILVLLLWVSGGAQMFRVRRDLEREKNTTLSDVQMLWAVVFWPVMLPLMIAVLHTDDPADDPDQTDATG